MELIETDRNGHKEKEELQRTPGGRLKACRRKANLTQKQLSELIFQLPENQAHERCEKQISYIECGKRALSSEYALLLAKVLKVRPEYLLCKDNYEAEEELTEETNRINVHITKMIEYIGYKIEENPHNYILWSSKNSFGISLSKEEVENLYSEIIDYIEFPFLRIIKQIKKYVEANEKPPSVLRTPGAAT